MISNPTTTVAFTGHRTYRDGASTLLADVVQQLYDEGFRTFLSGMAVGFDLAAAESVLMLRDRCPDTRLVCVVPFAGQECRFSAEERMRYGSVLGRADQVEYVCTGYHAGCYAQRNDRLVALASVLVAWYDGSPGGTHYTVRRAQRKGLRILNCCPEGPASPQLYPRLF